MYKNLLKYIKGMNRNRGFTLIEALVSITIMVMIFSSPLSLAFKMNSHFDYLQKKIIANNLAQEGVEIVTAFRANAAMACLRAGDCDTSNMLHYWSDVTDGFITQMLSKCATACAIDMQGLHSGIKADGSVDYSQFIAATNCKSMYMHDDGPYTCASYADFSGDATSGFARYIRVARYNDSAGVAMSGDTELLVVSGIKFYSNGQEHTVEVKSVLKIIN